MAHYVFAKYGEITHMTTFRTELVDLKRGERVILRSDRGTDLGVIVHPPFESETPPAGGLMGEILRRITSEDLSRLKHVEEVDMKTEAKYCNERILFHKLPMKLVDIEHVFGGEKIIFYFLAEGRVDFRPLVRDLAKEYRTRIELKQIGVRDEARLLADYDHCGREICCRTFIHDLEPVTMKMAKAQKATLDPTKISGRCGRLMCCLRYEDKVYDEMKRNLPRKGARVVTERGTAEVIDYDVISQTLRVEMQGGDIVKVQMKEVKQVIPRNEEEYQKRQQERAQHRAQQQQQRGAGPGDSGRGQGDQRNRGQRPRRSDGLQSQPPRSDTKPPAGPGPARPEGANRDVQPPQEAQPARDVQPPKDAQPPRDATGPESGSAPKGGPSAQQG